MSETDECRELRLLLQEAREALQAQEDVTIAFWDKNAGQNAVDSLQVNAIAKRQSFLRKVGGKINSTAHMTSYTRPEEAEQEAP